MNRIQLLPLLLLVLLTVTVSGDAGAQTPDCAGENVLGLVWSNGEFTRNGPVGEYRADLRLFNPTGRTVGGFDCRVVPPPSGVVLLAVDLGGDAVNIGTGGELIVAYRSQRQVVDGVVTLATLRFAVLADDQLDFHLAPVVSLPTVPAQMTVMLDGVVHTMEPVSGTFDLPVARLNGPDLPWCVVPFENFVEIATDRGRGFFAGTVSGASAGFDPDFDRIHPEPSPAAWFPAPAGAENYAYIRHDLIDRLEQTVEARVDGVAYAIPYGSFVAVPLGDFCFRECVLNEETGTVDCLDDCQFAIESGGCYTLLHDPDGEEGNLMMVTEAGTYRFGTDVRAPVTAGGGLESWRFLVETVNAGEVQEQTRVRFTPSFDLEEGVDLRLWDEDAGVFHELWPDLEYSFAVPAGATGTRAFVLYVGTAASGDTDGDGVLDEVDACPVEDASFFDRDGDGCIDPVTGGRHIEYWADGTLPLSYVIHAAGAPGISDGSDLAAVQAGIAAWSGVAGADVDVAYLGTTPVGEADALDLVNTVTFADDDYVFPSGVIAVGLSTSYLTPDYEAGYRPGQIIDVDMIFNPTMDFRTATQGSGVSIESVVTHEAGHWLGLAHSAVQTSTMFFVLPPDTTAASLEAEDRQSLLKAYPDPEAYAVASHLRGRVTDGWTGGPVPGAIVFVISAATGDTVGCDYTLPADGSFHFVGLPAGDYELAIHPLDGTSAIGYLLPDYINTLIRGTANTLFVPEFWDAAESSADDPADATPVTVSGGMTTIADFVTNIDRTGPAIVAVSPPDAAADVPIDAAILFRCDEAIDGASLLGNFHFAPASGGDLLAGSASLVEDGRVLAYVPAVNLEFGTTYRLEVGPGVADLFGNTMGSVFTTTFTTQDQPPVAMDNLVPRSGVAGSLVVVNGAGFSSASDGNVVTLGGEPLEVLEAAPSQLVVRIPEDAMPSTAVVLVQRVDLGSTSNPLSFTVLNPGEEARGLEIARMDLFAVPRRVEASPDGDRVFVATGAGLAGVTVADPGNPVVTSLAIGSGLWDLDVTPDGRRVFAIGRLDRMFHRIQVEPFSVLESVPLAFQPRGLLVGPSGRRAYMTTDSREIQVWDINEGSANFQRQIGSMLAPVANLAGPMATDPAGRDLLVLTGTGEVLVFDLETFALKAEIDVLPAARDIVVDPLGERAYVTGDDGYVSIVSLTSYRDILDLPVGGSLLGAAMAPTGSLIYVVDHQLDDLDVIDLRPSSVTYRGVSARLPQDVNPVDVAISPDGVYAYTIVEGSRQFAVTAVGTGPLLDSLSRRAGPTGARVVLAGADLAGAAVSFNGTPASVERTDGVSLTVAVPAGATSGPVTITGTEPGQVSNAVDFEILEESPAGGLREALRVRPAGLEALTGALDVGRNGKLLAVGGEDGRIHLLDIDPGSGDFTDFVGTTEPLAGPVAALAMAPNARSMFAVHGGTSAVAVLNIDPGSAAFGELLDTVMLDAAAPTALAVAPDGRCLLVADPSGARVHVVDRDAGTVIAAGLAGALPGLNGAAGRMAFHPDGLQAYLTVTDSLPAVVLVLDTDRTSATFGEVVGSAAIPAPAADAVPADLAFSPDGRRCLVLVGPQVNPGNRSLVVLDTSDPLAPVLLDIIGIPSSSPPMPERVRIAPAGDRALLNIRDDGLFLVDLAAGTLTGQADLVADHEPLDFSFAPDGSGVFVCPTASDAVVGFDFHGQQRLVKVWGDGQTGQTGQTLASSLRVRVTDAATGSGLAGVPVTFTIVPPAAMAAGGGGDKSSAAAGKGYAHVGAHPGTPDGEKDGGETLANAVVIPALPFADTGNTCDNQDDYDESCHLTSPGSPDVVYTWVADFSGGIDIDLCGSAYDTKLYVYADAVTPGAPLACNDDFYEVGDNCGDFVSRIPGLDVTSGVTYIIVIDGFAGDCGDYSLRVGPESADSPVGFFVTADPARRPTTLTVGSNSYGYAEAAWSLGAAPGTQAVDVAAQGSVGSPVRFTTTAVADPGAIPFALVPDILLPGNGATGVAVSTAVLAGFTKPVDPATINATTCYLSADGGATAVPAVIGLAHKNLAVSLTPLAILAYETTYTVVLGPGIRGAKGEPLPNPLTATFVTAAAPSAPIITAVAAPAAAAQVGVVLSGSGFDAVGTMNEVYFNDLAAPVLEAAPDFIRTRVPIGAASGTVRVVVRGLASNSLPFAVLEPTADGGDNVLTRVPTGSATRGVTVSPDGTRLYAVSPGADLVVPIDLTNFTTLPGIPVGDLPWSLDIHPDGDYVYVANRAGGDVSVIDTREGSPTSGQVVRTIPVGDEPIDIVVTPAGDRVIVANEASGDLSVIDGDAGSASFNQVLNRIPAGSGTRSVTVSPDGTLIYVGTDSGYLVLGAVDYGVLRTVPTGSAVKSVTVSPDGALLVVVDTQGILFVFDVAPGSPSMDQVLARVPTGSGVRTATVSPDGARLYAVMEEDDEIQIFNLDLGFSVGVTEQPARLNVLTLEAVKTIRAGENPESVVFDPSGSGRYFVGNTGDNTITVFSPEPATGTLAGQVRAVCPEASAPLAGVEVDVFVDATQVLVASALTGEDGSYAVPLAPGDYTVTLVTPLGYTLQSEEIAATITGGMTTLRDWSLLCEPVVADQRKMSYWKHQVAVALYPCGRSDVDAETLCGYLDLIALHFNDNALNSVTVYVPPVSGECVDKLLAAEDLLSPPYGTDWLGRARQELMAVLFNVASGRLPLRAVISQDGATVSQAITYVDFLIDDGDPANDELAMRIARDVNKGKLISVDIIPPGLPNIYYSPLARVFHLDQNFPNPFNPEAMIRFGIPRPVHVRLNIYDVRGSLVRTLVDEQRNTGTYIEVWDGADNDGRQASSGVYFYRIEAGSFTQTRKMLLMK